jgi:hypothetical protein
MPNNYPPNILTALGGVMPALPQAPDASLWAGSVPQTVVSQDSQAPGAAGLSPFLPPSLYPPIPASVQPAFPVGGPPPNPAYPSPLKFTNTLYNENSSQRQTPGGPSLDEVRQAMANAILNAKDQNVKPVPKTAKDFLQPGQAGAIVGGLMGGYKPAADAWFSSLDAALGALNRLGPPADGPGATAVFYNQRPTDSTDPNTNYGPPPLPFVGTLGPYYNPPGSRNQDPWWAFFGNKAK